METSAGGVAWRPTQAESAFATKLGQTKDYGRPPHSFGQVCRTMARFAEGCGLVSCKRFGRFMSLLNTWRKNGIPEICRR